MLKPLKQLKSLQHQSLLCGNTFTILCWNVAKLSQKQSFQKYLDELIKQQSVDFLLLQEVKESLASKISIDEYSYVLSANMQTKKHIFGVLSAFKIACIKDKTLLTSMQELSYMTHKSSLITHHVMNTNEELVVVNLHSINFVTSSTFKNELDKILLHVKEYSGAIIVAGDFNTWSKKRVDILREFRTKLGLKEVQLCNNKIKKVFNNSLDYVFYRGLHVESSKVIDSKKISDHNPIVVKFKIEGINE
ncbi:MAG: endonuclease/exonuclease/phosphatase family protein [Campylobacterota bacterium]|nr:endonuclease/exonuclease/phosphatase family protein [Campylobacterota bacterium]